MINAQKARFESQFRKDINDYENKIEKTILKAIEQGKFTCDFSIDCRVKNEIKQELIDNLSNLGYITYITDYNKEYANAPSDQRPYFDIITIDWRL